MKPTLSDSIIETHGIRVPRIPGIMSDRMVRVMEQGRYESGEVRILRRLLRSEDSVLEIGGGVGVVSSAAAGIVGARNVLVVEANPDLAPVIAQTHRLNDLDGIEILSGIGVTDAAGGEAPFYLREDFWASSMEPPADGEAVREVSVPRIDLNAQLRARRPSVLVMDIEGAEAGLLPNLDLSSCRALVVELHPRVYGASGVDRLFAALRRQGFAYDAKNSRGGTVVCFARVRPAPASTTRVTAVTCMKNEGPFILEWLAYHRSIGITDFVVFTNDCTDGTVPLLDRLDELGYVRHLPNVSKVIGSERHQPMALDYATRLREVRQADWIISMDVDEFLNIHVGDGSLGALFRRLGDANVISLVHLDFGDGGIERFEDTLLTETMTLCDKVKPETRTRRGIKTLIARTAPPYRISNHRPHFEDPEHPDLRWYDGGGKRISTRIAKGAHKGLDARGRYALGQINHYPIRSMETFLTKSRKGNVVAIDSFVGIEYWRDRNGSGDTDTTIRARLPAARRELDRLLAEPGVAALHAAAVDIHRAEIAELRQDAQAMDLLTRMKEEAACG